MLVVKFESEAGDVNLDLFRGFPLFWKYGILLCELDAFGLKAAEMPFARD